MCSLDFGEIACNKYPVLLLLLLLLIRMYIFAMCETESEEASGDVNKNGEVR